MLWLIDPDTWQAMEQARLAGLTPTFEQTSEFLARGLSEDSSGSHILTVAGSTAEISVTGALTPQPNLFAMLFGGGNTSYQEIRRALAEAEANPEVKEIVLKLDSPGGMVTGLFETIDALQAATKPITAKASSALSAAYALACTASSIEALGPGASFGSIGALAKITLDDKVVAVTSTNAPDKAPDVRTDEGKAVVQDYLDEIHGLFAETVARGRSVSVETVNQEFGHGRTFLAQKALEKGLIDSISRPTLRAVSQNTQAARGEGAKLMKFSEYRAAHPEEAASAISEGSTQERERVVAHLTLGEQCGDMSIAIEAIKQGVAFGHAPTQAQYMAAALNRKDQEVHAEDTQVVVEATSGAEAPEAKDMGDLIAEARLGKVEA